MSFDCNEWAAQKANQNELTATHNEVDGNYLNELKTFFFLEEEEEEIVWRQRYSNCFFFSRRSLFNDCNLSPFALCVQFLKNHPVSVQSPLLNHCWITTGLHHTCFQQENQASFSLCVSFSLKKSSCVFRKDCFSCLFILDITMTSFPMFQLKDFHISLNSLSIL